MKTILIVDADGNAADMARVLLSGRYEATAVHGYREACDLLGRRAFSLILLDLAESTVGDARDPIRDLARLAPHAALVCSSSRRDPAQIVGAARRGAAAFATKPYDPGELLGALRMAMAERCASGQADCGRAGEPALSPYGSRSARRAPGPDEPGADGDGLCCLLGDHPAIASVKERIRLYAQHDSPVLILGESGTGKELAAAELHARSSRRHRPFIPVDCASIPEALAESQLFGTVRGAFTGSVERRGVFEEGDGGTVFLDEVGELSLPVQAKLLRALETRSGARVGSHRQTRFDIRLVSATNSPLFDDPRRFRPELLNRLNTLVIRMPPLRNHPSDIPAMARAFLSRFDPGKELSPGAVEKLQEWHWPGNARELKNTIHRAAVLSGTHRTVAPDHIETQSCAAWGAVQGRLL